MSVLIGNNTGTFANAVNYPTAAEPKSVTVADINADAKLDVVTANPRPTGTTET